MDTFHQQELFTSEHRNNWFYKYSNYKREIIQVYINEIRYIGKELSILNFCKSFCPSNPLLPVIKIFI